MSRTIDISIRANTSNAAQSIREMADKIASGMDALGGAFDANAAKSNKLRLVQLELAKAQYELGQATDDLRKAQLQVQVDTLTKEYADLNRVVENADDTIREMANGIAATGVTFDANAAQANRLRLAQVELAKAQYELAHATDEVSKAQLQVRVDQLTKEYQSLTTVTDETETATTSFSDKIGALYGNLQQAAVAFGVLRIAQQAIEWGREGALVEATTARFEAFAGGAQQADQYLRDLRQATNYTISDFDAMAAVTKLLSMGLADNSAQASELAQMAIVLGDQTQSAGERISDFSLMLANQSVMRLDNFGISSGRVRQRIDELTAATPGLTREQAFLQATLEQGRISLDRVGDSAENQLSSWQRLDAATKGAGDQLKTLIADALTPAAEGLSLLLTYQQRVSDLMAEFGKTALASGMGWDEYNRRVLEAAAASGDLEKAKNDLRVALVQEGVNHRDIRTLMQDNVWVAEELARRNIRLGDSYTQIEYRAIQQGMAAVAQGYNDMGVAAGNAAPRLAEPIGPLMATEEALTMLSVAFGGKLGEQFDDFAAKNEELTAKAAGLRGEIAALEGQRWLSPKQKEELEELRGSLAETEQAIIGNAEAHEEATGRIIFSMAQQIAAQDGFTQAELDYLAQIGEAYGVLDQRSAEAFTNIGRNMGLVQSGTLSAKDAVDLLRGSIDALESKEIEVRTVMTQDHRQVGQPALGAVPMAAGGDFMVTRPTLFLAGEAGPERATFTPQHSAGNTGGGRDGMVVNIYPQQSTGSIYRDLQLVEAMNG